MSATSTDPVNPASLTVKGGHDPVSSVPVAAPAVSALVVTVHGEPAPQGSKRHVGGGRMIESSAKVAPWRQTVVHAVLAHRWFPMLTGPVSIEVTFTVRKPASAPKRRVTWPQRKPDLDKLVRSTFDALSDAGVWVDDAQVVELTARKVYPGEGLDALDHPGCVIRIFPM